MASSSTSCVTPGVLLGIDCDREKQSQSNDSFYWRDMGRKRHWNVGGWYHLERNVGLKVPLNVLGTMERKPLKARHEVCVQLSLQGSFVKRRLWVHLPYQDLVDLHQLGQGPSSTLASSMECHTVVVSAELGCLHRGVHIPALPCETFWLPIKQRCRGRVPSL